MNDERKGITEAFNRAWEYQTQELLSKYKLADQMEEPSTIYHYTNAMGLKGILTQKVIWATNSNYLNDVSEHRYARQVVDAVVGKRYRSLMGITSQEDEKALALDEIKQDCKRPLCDILGHILNTINTKDLAGYYVTSFCKSGNLLSQWRAYGGKGGYSIGISLDHKNLQNFLVGHELFHIHYDKSRQHQIITDLIGQAYGFLSRHPDASGFAENLNQDWRYLTVKYALQQTLEGVALSFKHQSFSEEDEYRVLKKKWAFSSKNIPYRERNGVLIPFIEIPLDDPAISITSVRCGPSLPAKARQSVKMLLEQYGYDNITVDESGIPLGE